MGELTIEAGEKLKLWLEMPRDQSFEDWHAIGERLHRTERVLNWWIGDWWAAGSHRYGERAKAAAEGIFGKDFGTLANAASVARAFEPSRRRELLSFSHHVATASLPPEDADAMLTKAASEGMTERQVRQAVRVWKTDAGILSAPTPSDDPEDDEFRLRSQAWNNTSIQVRLLMLQSLEEMGAISIVDEDKIGNIRLW